MINETTVCTYPLPWSDSTCEIMGESRSPFTKPNEAILPGFTDRNFTAYIGEYGHRAFGIFRVYLEEGTGKLRFQYGILLRGELIPTVNADEFVQSIDPPLTLIMIQYAQSPNGFPLYFNRDNQVITKVSVPILFDNKKPPVFEKGVTPAC